MENLKKWRNLMTSHPQLMDTQVPFRLTGDLRTYFTLFPQNPDLIKFKAKIMNETITYGHCFMFMPEEHPIHLMTFSSPTFESCDGEYRFAGSYLAYNLPADVETDILNALAAGKLEFYQEYHCDASREPKYSEIIDNRRYLLKSFACYAEKAQLYGHGDLIARAKIFSCEGIINSGQVAILGVKYIPLAITDKFARDIRSDVWRELHVYQKCSQLLFNWISWNFPALSSWFIIASGGVEFYENKLVRDKFAQSRAAMQISEQLDRVESLAHRDRDTNMGLLSEKFADLADGIKLQAARARNELILTDFTLAIPMTHTLKTLITPTTEYAVKAIDECFDDIIFQFIYGFHCLHSRLNVMHGDVHVNNLTLQPLSKLDDIHCYIVGDKEYYVRSHVRACIIDFSKCSIGDMADLVRAYGHAGANAYIIDQNKKIITQLREKFPDILAKHETEIENALRANFAPAFRAICNFDLLALARCLHVFADTRGLKSAYLDKITQIIGEGISRVLRTITTAGDIDSSDIARDALDAFIRPVPPLIGSVFHDKHPIVFDPLNYHERTAFIDDSANEDLDTILQYVGSENAFKLMQSVRKPSAK